MAKSADIRPGITLACTECKERNYITTKNRRNTPDRLELKKFCSRCRKQTAHRFFFFFFFVVVVAVAAAVCCVLIIIVCSVRFYFSYSERLLSG